MNGNIETSSSLNPTFPFTAGSGFSGYLFRNNQPELYRIILLKKGGLVYTTETAYERISVPALFFITPLKRCSLKPFPGTESDFLLFSPSILGQLQFFCWTDRLLRNFIQQFIRTDNQENQEKNNKWLALHPVLLGQVTEVFRIILGEWGKKHPCCEILIIQQMVRLFILLFRNTDAGNREESPAVWQIDDLIDYINKNYADEFSLSEMAEKYSFSPSYFSRRFREKTGMPLFEYINHIRIQKACLLLKRSQMPIIEIAYAVGYNNLSFFNRYFRKIMQVSPRDYRNQVQR